MRGLGSGLPGFSVGRRCCGTGPALGLGLLAELDSLVPQTPVQHHPPECEPPQMEAGFPILSPLITSTGSLRYGACKNLLDKKCI